MLVLPRIRLLLAYFKQHFGNTDKNVNAHSNRKDQGKSLHYRKLVILALHFQVGKSASESADDPDKHEKLECNLWKDHHEFDGLGQWLVLVYVKDSLIDGTSNEEQETQQANLCNIAVQDIHYNAVSKRNQQANKASQRLSECRKKDAEDGQW